jgi:LysR family hca operon transcriptional activator
MQGKVDVALLRREKETIGLAFKFLIAEPLIALVPATHRLAERKTVRPKDLEREVFVGLVIKDYAAKAGITFQQS